MRNDWWEDDETYQKLLNNDDIPSGETQEKNILLNDWCEDDETYQKLLNNDDIPSGDTWEKNICEMIDGRMMKLIENY